MKRLIIPVLLTVLLLPSMLGCDNNGTPDDTDISSPAFGFHPEVEILNAYCVYSPSSAELTFDFRFTLKNLKNEDIAVNYLWTLNDPSADEPVYQGEDNASLLAGEEKPIIISIEPDAKYDPRFYIMYISVYRGDAQMGYYREQKSTYDWDYSTLPPVRRTGKPSYKHIWIDTFVEKTPSGYRVNIDRIIFLPPERIARLNLNNICLSGGCSLADMLVDNANPDEVGFHDVDNNRELTAGDYLVMNDSDKGKSIEFESRDEPSLRINQIGHHPETIEEENRDAIRIQNVEYWNIDDWTIELEVKVISEKLPECVEALLYSPGEGGVSSSNPHLELSSAEGDTLIYRKIIDVVFDKGELYLLIIITDGTNEVIHVVGELN